MTLLLGSTVHPLTPDRWPDLERLFVRANGDCARCWCMWWRISRAQFERNRTAGNKAALKAVVDSGDVPGLLAYAAPVPSPSRGEGQDGGETVSSATARDAQGGTGKPVGWVSVAPRDRYLSLERSRRLARVDGQPVWSIVCFVVDKDHRGQGVMAALLGAAVDYATQHAARIVEAYPKDPDIGPVSQSNAYTGIVPAFRKAGFVEVARHAKGQPVMRLSKDAPAE